MSAELHEVDFAPDEKRDKDMEEEELEYGCIAGFNDVRVVSHANEPEHEYCHRRHDDSKWAASCAIAWALRTRVIWVTNNPSSLIKIFEGALQRNRSAGCWIKESGLVRILVVL
jgi:hypothetical protein